MSSVCAECFRCCRRYMVEPLTPFFERHFRNSHVLVIKIHYGVEDDVRSPSFLLRELDAWAFLMAGRNFPTFPRSRAIWMPCGRRTCTICMPMDMVMSSPMLLTVRRWMWIWRLGRMKLTTKTTLVRMMRMLMGSDVHLCISRSAVLGGDASWPGISLAGVECIWPIV